MRGVSCPNTNGKRASKLPPKNGKQEHPEKDGAGRLSLLPFSSAEASVPPSDTPLPANDIPLPKSLHHQKQHHRDEPAFAGLRWCPPPWVLLSYRSHDSSSSSSESKEPSSSGDEEFPANDTFF
ncbi:hypothetical protein H920_16241 [Fukomys damarensis]|uniref:Uncharacterized protein n=1 Tax=Fukomys damarensis TaxID=885580 RepID=A0A091CW48_FUKDA|nr:hypothetical protein H920_16241 [Fukomys damarensis]